MKTVLFVNVINPAAIRAAVSTVALVVALMVLPQITVGQEPTTDEPAAAAVGQTLQKFDDGKIQFSFANQPWKSVIEFFAEQTELSLQPITQPPPETFNYFDKERHTVSEAMDILNHALLLKGYTLVRKENMLILQQDGQIDWRLIEEVTPEQLKERGRYEMLKCTYSLVGLEELGIPDQVSALITSSERGNFHVFPAAGTMSVTALGGVLRDIDGIISQSRIQLERDSMQMFIYDMKFIDPESLLITVRDLMDFEGDSNVSRDGMIVISVQPLGNKLFVNANQAKWEQFLKVAEKVDAKPDAPGENLNMENSFVKPYEVTTAPELTAKVLETFFEGREGIKMDQDPESGTIYLLGRQADHDLADHVLGQLAKGSPGHAIIKVYNADAEDILEKLKMFFQQSVLDDTAAQGPVLFGDEDTNEIYVRGTPQEVALVRQMVSEMDSAEELDMGPRTQGRFIEVESDNLDQAERLLDGLPDLFFERTNKLNIIMPTDRSKFRSRNRLLYPSQPADPLDEFIPNFDTPPARKAAPAKRGSGATYRVKPKTVYVGFTRPVQDENESVGESSQENSVPKNSNYQRPEEPQSVPNAPIEVKLTPMGIKLYSEDLDALDDLEVLIRNRLKKDAKPAGPTVFPLRYRRVEKVKPMLEEFYGIAGGGGGGGAGGGITGAIGGVLGNAIGGGAGDLLGGMFGGGGAGGDSGSVTLEGDVVFGQDVKFNLLIVTGATDLDLDSINEMLELFDQPEPPQIPDTAGETYYIPVNFRDVVELKDMITAALPDYIQGAGGGAQGGNQNPQAAQARAMQEVIKAAVGGGGRRGGGGGGGASEEAPKATLTVDNFNSALVLTGPRYIYEKVYRIVQAADQPVEAPSIEYVPLKGKISAQALATALQGIYGDKIVVDDGSNGGGGAAGKAAGGRTATSGRPATGATATPNQAAEIFRRIQQQQQGGGFGGRGGGGGRQGGGGGRQGGGGRRGGR